MFWSLIVLGIVLWLVLRKPKPTPNEVAARERAARAENDALAEFNFEDRSEDSKRLYQQRRIDFLFNDMVAVETAIHRTSGAEERTTYHLRRVDSTKWQLKMSSQSRDAQIAEIEREPLEDELDEAIRKDDRASLGREPQWVDVPDTVTGPLETHYQRYLMHYRRPVT